MRTVTWCFCTDLITASRASNGRWWCCDAGHGGKVLLSKSTAALVEDALLDDLSLRDLGA